MYRTSFCVEAVILLLLSHVGWNGPGSIEEVHEGCSRHGATLVRHVVQKKIISVLDRYRVSLPTECPFHPERDVFWWPASAYPESESRVVSTCPICGRTFFCVHNLTHHWDTQHAQQRQPPNDGICLASYCDVMRCNVLDLHMAHDSTPPQERHRLKPIPQCRKNNSRTPIDNPNDPCYCDPKEMDTLQQKCKVVMQQCTAGLLASLQMKDYKDLEAELNQNICSYLTCDKYWENNLKQVKRVSTALVVVLGGLLCGGFCLCYYIVWIVFDNAPYESHYNYPPVYRKTQNGNLSRQRSAPISNPYEDDDEYYYRKRKGGYYTGEPASAYHQPSNGMTGGTSSSHARIRRHHSASSATYYNLPPPHRINASQTNAALAEEDPYYYLDDYRGSNGHGATSSGSNPAHHQQHYNSYRMDTRTRDEAYYNNR